MKRQKIIMIGIIILVLCIFLFQMKKNPNKQFKEELIFFKLFSFAQKRERDTNNTKNQETIKIQKYIFNVSYKNIDFKKISLSDTINKETLVRNKIAPRNKRSI